ncbi:MAG: hypothetical protein F6K14_11145 [Symploca sp. SIO2C1]|nr:hypothetical protein [Symploca sp. SIO2C1]
MSNKSGLSSNSVIILTPDSYFKIRSQNHFPNSQFPIPNSQFPILKI